MGIPLVESVPRSAAVLAGAAARVRNAHTRSGGPGGRGWEVPAVSRPHAENGRAEQGGLTRHSSGNVLWPPEAQLRGLGGRCTFFFLSHLLLIT